MRARSPLLWLLPAAGLMLAACGGGDSKSSSGAGSPPPPTVAASASAGSPAVGGTSAGALPGQMFPSQGNAHVASADAPHAAYSSNPPTSGPHLASLPRAGIYAQAPPPELIPHFLEHGGVWVMYNCPQGCDADVQALRTLVSAQLDQGRPVALSPYPNMPGRFAAVAWEYLLAMDALDRAKLDDFIARLACNYNPEGGPYCVERRGELKP